MPAALLNDIQHDWMLQEYARALTRMEAHWRAAPHDPQRRLHYATILGHCSRFHTARAQLDELIAAASSQQRLWALGSAGVECCDFQRFEWAAEYMQQAAAEPNPPVASPYLALGVQHDLKDVSSIAVGGTALRDQVPHTTGEVSTGFNGSLRPGLELHLDVRSEMCRRV